MLDVMLKMTGQCCYICFFSFSQNEQQMRIGLGEIFLANVLLLVLLKIGAPECIKMHSGFTEVLI